MIDYFYLISSIIFVASTSIFCGFYNRRNEDKKDASALYNFLLVGSVSLFWIIKFLFDFKMEAGVIWYSFLFAACYTICNVALINALKCGPIGLTSLIMELAMIGVTVWGFLFWDTEFSLLIAVGLILVCVALSLCLYTGKAEEGGKINFRWLVFALLSFAGNAGCTIVQRTQQMKFNAQYGDFMMALASLISLVICLITYLRSNRSDTKAILKGSWYWPVASGLCNGLLNLFVIFLATSKLSASLIYPVIAIGALSITTICSAFVFKDKMRWWQWVGIVIGVAAVGILSI